MSFNEDTRIRFWLANHYKLKLNSMVMYYYYYKKIQCQWIKNYNINESKITINIIFKIIIIEINKIMIHYYF